MTPRRAFRRAYRRTVAAAAIFALARSLAFAVVCAALGGALAALAGVPVPAGAGPGLVVGSLLALRGFAVRTLRLDRALRLEDRLTTAAEAAREGGGSDLRQLLLFDAARRLGSSSWSALRETPPPSGLREAALAAGLLAAPLFAPPGPTLPQSLAVDLPGTDVVNRSATGGAGEEAQPTPKAPVPEEAERGPGDEETETERLGRTGVGAGTEESPPSRPEEGPGGGPENPPRTTPRSVALLPEQGPQREGRSFVFEFDFEAARRSLREGARAESKPAGREHAAALARRASATEAERRFAARFYEEFPP